MRFRFQQRSLPAFVAVFAFFAGAVTTVLLSAKAEAQGYQITAGSSNLTGVDGITLSKFQGDRTSLMSFGGTGNGFVFGAATEVRRGDGILRYGDTAMGFTLPTDLDSAGRSVGARGVQWSLLKSDSSVRIFAGKTGNSLQFGYLNTLDAARWAGSVEWQKALRPKVSVSALAAVGAAHAALLSMTWDAAKYRQYAVTTGWNAGHPVSALSAKLRGQSWSLQASETLGRLELRPETSTPLSALLYRIPEREGLNFNVEKKWRRWLTTDAGRVAYAKDALGGLPWGAQMYDGGATASEGRLSQGVRLFESKDGPELSQGVALLARYMQSHWSVEASLMESRLNAAGDTSNGGSAEGGRTQSFVMSATRSVGGRLKMTGGADFNGGTPTYLAGGEIAGAWGSFGVSETVVYVPFGPGAGFSRVTEFSLKAHPRGVVEGTVDMLVGRNVPWSYTTVASSFIEHGGDGGEKAHFRSATVAVPQYVLRGVVLDQVGAPVASAAVRVGEQIVYTNDQGEWEYRQKKPIPVALHVAPEEFVTVRKYASADADEQVTPMADKDAKPIVMHVFYDTGNRGKGDREVKPVEAFRDDFAEPEAKKGGDGVWVRLGRLVMRGEE